MRFRNLLIANPARISIRNEQLYIEQFETIRFPIEDIATVMLESRQFQISTAALEKLAVNGITVFLCDENIFLPPSFSRSISSCAGENCCSLSLSCINLCKRGCGKPSSAQRFGIRQSVCS